ncbi:hypothetical protein Srufu_008340 [Streptomyces libani subsp. rufus]|nr:hypothetical protein Srufu_008340 [Streptomyces libani subsp. rufus]
MTLLALTSCAVLTGARSLLAVSEWVADAPPALLEHLGTAVAPLVPKRSWPAESTIRRLLARIDADALDRAVGAWLADRQTRGQELRGLAVDGKSLRGAARPVARFRRVPPQDLHLGRRDIVDAGPTERTGATGPRPHSPGATSHAVDR